MFSFNSGVLVTHTYWHPKLQSLSQFEHPRETDASEELPKSPNSTAKSGLSLKLVQCLPFEEASILWEQGTVDRYLFYLASQQRVVDQPEGIYTDTYIAFRQR